MSFLDEMVDSLLDQAIEEHRIAVTAQTVRAMNMDNDGAEIRAELARADAELKEKVMVLLTAKVEGTEERLRAMLR